MLILRALTLPSEMYFSCCRVNFNSKGTGHHGFCCWLLTGFLGGTGIYTTSVFDGPRLAGALAQRPFALENHLEAPAMHEANNNIFSAMVISRMLHFSAENEIETLIYIYIFFYLRVIRFQKHKREVCTKKNYVSVLHLLVIVLP